MRCEMTGKKDGNDVGWRAAQRHLSAGARALAVVGLILSAAGAVGSASAAATPSGFGALPANWNEQSRCQGVHVGSHVVLPGKDVVATTSAGICGAAPKDINWSWSGGLSGQTHGCGNNQTKCRFPAGSTGGQYVTICINGSNIQGAWQSCDYYGVPAKGVGIIEGYVKDEDGSPVAGVTVDAKGKHPASTTTGADGYYAMQVQPGHYQIVPSGGPHGRSAPEYHPKVNTTSIAAGSSGTADFTLQDGIELQLHFAKTAVAADGLQVVNGTITTTWDGNPVSVGVQLQGMPGVSPTKAVTSGPLASVCGGGTRVWPTGTCRARMARTSP